MFKKTISKFTFSPELAEKISSEILEGKTVQKVAKELGIPPHIIYLWQRKSPEFEEMIKTAREYRSHYYHDKIIEIAEMDLKHQDVSVSKLKVDIYKWAAKVGNRELYGDQTKIKGDKDSPVHILVNTGIIRQSDEEKYPEIESKN